MVATRTQHTLRTGDLVRFKYGLRQVQGRIVGVLGMNRERETLYRVEFSVGEESALTAIFAGKDLMLVQRAA
jgi:hypothetical protein